MSEERKPETKKVKDEELEDVSGGAGEYVERLGSRGMTGRTAEPGDPTD